MVKAASPLTLKCDVGLPIGHRPSLFLPYMMEKKPTQPHALLIMTAGITASGAWEYFGLSGDLYNVLPGLVAGMLSYYLFLPLFKRAD